MTPGGRTLEFPSDRFLRISGTVVLQSAFGLLLAMVLLAAWKMPAVTPFMPLLPLTALAGWMLFRRPLLNLAIVISLFFLIADFEEGIQLTEVVYGLYYLGFLGHWFFTRLILGQNRVFYRFEDTLLFAFLMLIVLSVPLTIVFNGSLGGVVGELLSYSMLAFYFPVKEAVSDRKNGLHVITGAVMVVGTVILVRNFVNYQDILASATYAWQVTRGRAVTNEALLMVPAFLCLSWYVTTRVRAVRWATALAFVLFFAGLVLTQSRGYWVAFLFGTGILFLLVPWSGKFRLLSTALLAGIGVFTIGIFLFGDYILLVLTGLTDRFLSIATAIIEDDSLRNRFNETAAVWERIKVNPILGYGMGVPYTFYDFTVLFSHTRTFVHNGYVALWFKFGIWGLGMMLLFLSVIVQRAISVFRSDSADRAMKAAGLAVAGSFAGFSVSAITSNPFFDNDKMFIFAVLAGMAGGLYTRVVRAETGIPTE